MANGEDRQPDQGSSEGGTSSPPGGSEPAPVARMPAAGGAPPPVVPPSRPVGGSEYPIGISVDTPSHIARWRPIVQWILAIPLFIVLYVLRFVLEVLGFIGWIAALFTGQLPEGIGNFLAGVYRYAWRTYSYALFLRESYPPFAPELGYSDPGDDPARFDVRRGEGLSRLAVLFRIILVIPQAIVIFFLGIALYIAAIVGFFAVLFTGEWPEGLHDFVVGACRWILRVDAWFFMLADPYPPFALN